MGGVGVFQKGLLNELSQEYAKISKSEPGIWVHFTKQPDWRGEVIKILICLAQVHFHLEGDEPPRKDSELQDENHICVLERSLCQQ